MTGDDVEALLAEQRTYYRERAPEYDDWWVRRGLYDNGPEFLARWQADVAGVYDALDAFAPGGDVLELAAGTGNFSLRLARHAERLTLVDANEETLAIARSKLAALADPPPVETVVADLFTWEPPRRFDHVVFTFWLSHVPTERFVAFWALVERALAPGGRVFFVDSLDRGHTEVDPETGVARRSLSDGRRFRLVKVFWDPAELEEKVRGVGWDARVESTSFAFLYGWATPAPARTRR